ncbi:hypothetical protein [Croceibacterium aestuarii]|uniref:hypothetical protein n=1 Tax=Croceibacterium aestuarii TaxID=3064139 RepID=UPI00272E5E03|nr:hypothetical protein [Croceibacterium sp. D39]
MTDQSNPPKPPKPLVNTRAIPRQATSRAAFRGEPLDPDDPLLSFRPVPHKAPRRNSITAARQRAFVAELAASGIVTQAALAIGASKEALYKLRNRPGAEAFAAAWDEALYWGAQRLEDCALQRALDGAFEDPKMGWAGRGNGLLIYLIGRRGPFKVDERDLVPGHPVYERIRAEVLADAEAGG